MKKETFERAKDLQEKIKAMEEKLKAYDEDKVIIRIYPDTSQYASLLTTIGISSDEHPFAGFGRQMIQNIKGKLQVQLSKLETEFAEL